MTQVYEQYRKEFVSEKEDGYITKLLSTLQPDGSWEDIGYSKTDIAEWQPIAHLDHLKTMALAYVGKSKWHDDTELRNAIINALQFWYTKDPHSKNWWHNEIDVPQHLGELLIILRQSKNKIPSTLEDSLIERMKRGDIYKQTGANKLDVATHYIYRAALTANAGLMDSSVKEVFEPISFTDKEGLQYDNSFMQHGKQLQISSYGSVFIGGEYKVAAFLRNTRYALGGEQLKMLSTYYLNTYMKALRGGYSDFNIEGRGISRVDMLNKKHEQGRLKLAAMVDQANNNEWEAVMARTNGKQAPSFKLKPSHTHFYCADYTLHTQPDYSFNVRMVSNRTKRTESGNGENLIGKFLPDGATNIQVKGDEYYNIMPVWEWDKIPGTTERDYADDQLTTVFWGEVGSMPFAGGVSDSSYGVSAYDMNYNGVTAKKSWFFFDKEVVCLGAGINCKEVESITTTINQCWLKGAIEVEGDKVKGGGIISSEHPSWIRHDGVGYYFLEKEKVFLSTIKQTGDWYHINHSTPKKVQSGEVFKLWINHGANPSNAHYAYVVVPNANKNTLDDLKANLKIIANTEAVQMVRNEALDITEAVLYKPATITVGEEVISIDKPCILMIRDTQKATKKLYIADPTQLETEGTINIANHKTNASKVYTIHFPKGNKAGASILVEVE